LQFAK
jgi:hypothetical protein